MFIHLGGPPVFKLLFFLQLLLINRGGIINPHLTLSRIANQEVKSHIEPPRGGYHGADGYHPLSR